jgi:hypothetical protein
MPLDPRLRAEAALSAGRLARDPAAGHDARFLALDVVPALLSEIERLERAARGREELLEVARRELQRLRASPGGEAPAETTAGERRFVPPTGACPNCTLEWWEHTEDEQRVCREALGGG